MRSYSRGAVFCVALVFLSLLLGTSSTYSVCKYGDKADNRYLLSQLLHEYGDPAFGEDSTLLDDHPTFTAAFELWLTPGASAALNDSLIEYFVDAIADEDTTDKSDDLYPLIWDYFCHEDDDPSYPGLEFTVGSTTYTKIKINLYDPEDLALDPSTLGVIDADTCYYGTKDTPICQGYSTAGQNAITISVCGTPGMSHLLGMAFAHEFQHIAYDANGSVATWAGGQWGNEGLAALAEHIAGAYRWNTELPYDASVYVGEACDANRKYVIWKAWLSYLYDVFPGPTSDIEDDAVYRWIRQAGTSTDFEISMQTLADVLWDDDFDYLGGSDATERFQIAFGNYAVAKFANAPDFASNSIFGYQNLHSQIYLRFFDDVWDSYGTAGFDCLENVPGGVPTPATGGGWNVRVLPPVYTVGSSLEDTTTTVSGTYYDADGSSDYIDVSIYGTDYIIFTADSYYDDDDEHDFVFSLSGQFASAAASDTLQVWLVAYDVEHGENASGGSTLPASDDDILFIEPLTPRKGCDGIGSYCVDAVVSDFGRRVKSVVVVIAPVESGLQTGNTPGWPYAFTYEYSYGVYSRTVGKTAVWKGDVFLQSDVIIPEQATLQIDDNTTVNIAAIDWLYQATPRVHFGINGALDVNGVQGGVVAFVPWDGSSTWDGLNSYKTATLDIDWALVNGASNGLQATGGDVTVTNSTFADCSNGAIFRWDGGDIVVYSCLFDSCNIGLAVQDTATVTCEETTFRGNNIGVNSSASNGGEIVLGVTGSPIIAGDNRFIDNVYFDIMALSDTVYAQHCWWGSDECPTSTFYGPVVCEPALDEDPLGGGGGGGGDGEKFPHPRIEPVPTVGDRPAPLANALVNAYPNPFNPQVTIEFSVADGGGRVIVGVYNVRGQLVATLVDDSRPSGLFKVKWTGINTSGQEVPSGVYFVRMLAPGYEAARKIVLLK